MAFDKSNKRVLSSCFAVWFAVTQALFGVAPTFAQQTGSTIDLDPPLIEHEIISEVESNTRQTFVASVVDDDELESVRMFYRFSGEPTYSSVLMNRVSYSSSYIAQINTDPNIATTIEYYIQARDQSGNRTVRGYAFNPLMRSITVEDAGLAGNTRNTGLKDTSATESGRSRKTLYIVIGVLTLGLLASLANSGSSKSSNSCADSGCILDINIDMPVVTNE
ncbi:MAG: hypothetical protein V3U65_14400 [Granulosicoccaceae bacterium]